MTSTDATTAGLAATVLLPMTAIMAYMSLPTGEATFVVVCAALMHLTVLWRTTHSTRALVAATACLAVQSIPTGLFILFPSSFVLLSLVHATAAYGNRVAGLVGVVAGSAAVSVRFGLDPETHGFGPEPWLLALLLAAVGGIAWTMGSAQRSRMETARLTANVLDAERRERHYLQERAIAVEKERTSRDLHDILAHSLTVIVAQARVARFEPERSGEALAVVDEAARAALRDLRATLQTLRSAEASRRPGVDDIGELLDRVTAIGTPVTRSSAGEPRPLPEDAGLALYRFVQEALTNATRHAPGRAVACRVRWGAEEVAVTVTNERSPGAAVDASGAGLGFLGMRERLALVGGRLDVADGTEFGLTAVVPALAEGAP